MKTSITLAQYVKYRNGVPLGGQGALQNMLSRAFGASTFAKFWQYWNPVWGFYLAKYVYGPLSTILPKSMATVATFAVSGALHDLAVMLLKQQVSVLITVWFTLMGCWLALSAGLRVRYGQFGFSVRALINLMQITVCFYLAKYLISLI